MHLIFGDPENPIRLLDAELVYIDEKISKLEASIARLRKRRSEVFLERKFLSDKKTA